MVCGEKVMHQQSHQLHRSTHLGLGLRGEDDMWREGDDVERREVHGYSLLTHQSVLLFVDDGAQMGHDLVDRVG